MSSSKIRQRMKAGSRIAATLGSLALLLAAAPAAQAAETTADGLKLVTVVNTVSRMGDDSFLPVLVGQSQGIFKKHGLEVQVAQGKTSQIASASLVAGRAQIALIQPAYVVSANAAGASFQMLGTIFHNLDYDIITSTDIKELKQLEGKIMAGPGPNNGNTIVFRAALEKAGVDSSTLTYATVGAQAGILAALQTGQAQAGVLSTVAARDAVAAGLIDQGPVSKYLPNQTAVAITSTKDLLASDGDVIRTFMEALAESNQWVLDNKEAALGVLAKATNVTPDEVRPDFEADFPLLGPSLAMDTKGLQDWNDIALQYKLIDKPVSVDDIYTPAFLPK
jgi:NitT/TauT family transport system substrate-binding protein